MGHDPEVPVPQNRPGDEILKTDQETKYVFKMVNGQWEFTFAWYDHYSDQVDVMMQKNRKNPNAVWNPLAGFWKFIIEAYMALTGDTQYRFI